MWYFKRISMSLLFLFLFAFLAPIFFFWGMFIVEKTLAPRLPGYGTDIVIYPLDCVELMEKGELESNDQPGCARIIIDAKNISKGSDGHIHYED